MVRTAASLLAHTANSNAGGVGIRDPQGGGHLHEGPQALPGMQQLSPHWHQQLQQQQQQERISELSQQQQRALQLVHLLQAVAELEGPPFLATLEQQQQQQQQQQQEGPGLQGGQAATGSGPGHAPGGRGQACAMAGVGALSSHSAAAAAAAEAAGAAPSGKVLEQVIKLLARAHTAFTPSEVNGEREGRE